MAKRKAGGKAGPRAHERKTNPTRDPATDGARVEDDIIERWQTEQNRPDASLPLLIRNQLVQLPTHLNNKGFFEEVSRVREALLQVDPTLPVPLSESAINEAMQASQVKGSRWVHAYFNHQRAKAGLPPVTFDEYQNRVFQGERAIDQFKAWMDRLPDQISLLPPPVAAWPESGDKAKTSALQFMRGETEQRFMVLNTRLTLTQCSTHFVRETIATYCEGADRLPVFYMPAVGRPGPPLPAAAARLVPKETAFRSRLGKPGGARCSLSLIVGLLRAFLTGQSAEETRLPTTGDELWEAILEVRALLALRPAIIVFDGYSVMGNSLAALRSMLSGDSLSVLLPHLLEDWPGMPGAPVDRLRAQKTRILVLADDDPPEFELYAPLVENLPAPSPGYVAQIFHQGTRDQVLFRRLGGAETPDLHRVTSLGGATVKRVADEDIFALHESFVRLQAFGGDDEPPAALFDASVEIVTIAYLERLKTVSPASLLALRFVALSPGGLRLVTLHNLLRQWRQSCVNEPPHLQLESAPTIEDLAVLFTPLQPVAVTATDDYLHALDEAARPWAYLDPPPSPARLERTRLRMVDLRSRRLREAVVNHLYTKEERPIVARMHRALSEELLRQHAVITRHRGMREPMPVDAVQALCALLFHGWASLACGANHEDVKIKSLARTLPLNPQKIYVRLFSIFYHHLIDPATAGEYAPRIQSYETLRSDLLQVANCVDAYTVNGRSVFYNRNRTPEVMLPSFLAPRAPNMTRPPAGETSEKSNAALQEHMFMLAHTQLLHLAQSLLHQGRTEEAKQCCDAADDYEVKGAAQNDFRVSIDEMRLKILRIEEPRNTTSFDEFAQRTGLTSNRLNEVTVKIGDATRVSGSNAAQELERHAKNEAQKLCLRALDSTEEAEPPVLIQRANFIAHFADFAWIPNETVDPQDNFARHVLLQPFIAFRLAEHVRRRAFDLVPLTSNAVADSHHVRSFVRVSLRLARALTNEIARQEGFPAPAYFLREARRQADLQTLFYGRSNEDRASIHILESRFFPLVAPLDLDEAYGCLQEAEKWILPVNDRPRVRMRLLYERGVNLRIQAERCLTALENATVERQAELLGHACRLIETAQTEFARLGRYVTYFSDRYWEDLYTHGAQRLQQVSAGILKKIAPLDDASRAPGEVAGGTTN